MNQHIYRSLLMAIMLAPMLSNAQTFCDSLVIHATTFDPLNSDTKVQVIVENESSIFFSYPKFILRDAQNDTVASEMVNFFGIGNYKQTHTLTLHDTNSSTLIANGTLQLYSIDDTLVCEWQDDFDLCVDTCVDLVVIMQGTEFPSAYHRYAYSIMDSTNTIVMSDTLSVDSAQYTDRDTICLPKGAYTAEFIEESSAVNEDVHVRVDPFFNTSGPVATGQGDLSFDLNVFTACLDSVPTPPTGVHNTTESNVSIYAFNHQLYVMGLELEKAELSLFDMRGKMVYSTALSGEMNRIYLGRLSSGMYVARVQDGANTTQQKVFVP